MEGKVRVGIVGLPQVGKTTIFNLLTKGDVSTSAWGGGRGDAHIGVARVPDWHVDELAKLFRPEKVTYATVDYVDVPGLARGDHSRDMSGYLTSLKNIDALVHVVRAFDDEKLPHPEGSVDPRRDIDVFELEMILSDLAIVEKRLERLSKDLKKAKSADLELENSVLERYKSALESEKPLRGLELTAEEEKRVKGYTFLSAKPMLLVVNLGDGDTAKISRIVDEFVLQQHASRPKVRVTAVCGKIEAEIASLPSDDAKLFMEDLGLTSSGLDRIIQESYSLLGLVSFYTGGDPEVRAWTIPKGINAQQAAGVIHTDFEKGFIKAEVVSFPDLMKLGSFQAAKAKGALRLEGKEYIVQEEDVMLFRFNV
jgi:GTP-binding protein YchF